MYNIYHGDAPEFLRTMGDKSVDLVLTDPPYDFDNDYKRLVHMEMERVSRGAVIVFSPPENQWVSPADQYLFWVKPISTKNTKRSYSRFVEMIFVYGNGYWNTERHWSQYTNVFTDLVDGETNHPHEKPLSLLRRLVLNHSQPNDVVLDPFMGSGTTGVASVSLGRRFVGFEKEHEYYDIAFSRLTHD